MTDRIPWTTLGVRPLHPRPSYVALALAMLLAWPVMVSVSPTYPTYMTVMALGAGTWGTILAVRAKALIGLLLAPTALLWLHPILGADWYTHEGPAFFLPHAAIALLLAIAGYTFAATERA